jgi:hypothetical protein
MDTSGAHEEQDLELVFFFALKAETSNNRVLLEMHYGDDIDFTGRNRKRTPNGKRGTRHLRTSPSTVRKIKGLSLILSVAESMASRKRIPKPACCRL